MFAILLQGGGETQKFVRVESIIWQDIDEPGLALGERACLVHDQRGDLLQVFERLSVLHEHAELRAASDADHDGHRRGQTKRTWASDDENCDGIDNGMREPGLRADPHPDDEGDQ